MFGDCYVNHAFKTYPRGKTGAQRRRTANIIFRAVYVLGLIIANHFFNLFGNLISSLIIDLVGNVIGGKPREP